VGTIERGRTVRGARGILGFVRASVSGSVATRCGASDFVLSVLSGTKRFSKRSGTIRAGAAGDRGASRCSLGGCELLPQRKTPSKRQNPIVLSRWRVDRCMNCRALHEVDATKLGGVLIHFVRHGETFARKRRDAEKLRQRWSIDDPYSRLSLGIVFFGGLP
jgi:hypothetical protein